jgi:Na+-driven multidrug efflux pump
MEAISYGVTRMGFICLTYFICGLMDSLTGGLRGLGASMAPMVICILGVCVFRVGWIYTIFQIPQFHTPQCLYLSYPISWLITFVFELIAFIMVYKKRVKSLS